MAFMPEYFEEPKLKSGYLNPASLEEGTYKIRILSEPIVGWERWVNKKPERFQFDQNPEEPGDGGRDPYIFTAMIVWNYGDEAIQILHIKQASLRKALCKYAADPDFGDPYLYDIKISKEGEGKNTEYGVVALRPTTLDPKIANAFKEKPIWLGALFRSEDPFKPSKQGEITPMATGGSKPEIETASIFSDPLKQEFASLCAARSKINLGDFYAKMPRGSEEEARFIEHFERWKATQIKAKSA